MAGMLGGIGSIFGGGGGGGGLGGIMGILNSINQMSGGKIFGSTSVPFVPQGLEGVADKNWQQMYGDLWDQMQKNNPQLAAQMQSGFQGGQQMQPQIQGSYQNLAGMTPQMMQILMGQAGTAGQAQQGLMNAGNQFWQNSLDPQNAMRNQLQQQVIDQSRAGSSARGIGMAPQAAGLENQANTNFLNQWQNQQLGRQAQGLQGMTGAYNQAGQQGQAVGRNLTGAMEMGALGPQFMQQSAQYPFWLANMFGGGMQSNIFGPLESAMTSGQNYMNTGVPATANSFAAGQTGMANFDTAMRGLSQLYQQQQQGPQGYQTDPYAMGGYGT